MKKHFLTCSKICTLALIGAGAFFFTSCAKDGFDEETFSSSVTNSQLASPELSKDNFSTQVNTDGSESVVVTWKAVMGAGGYECAAYNIDDPDNPTLLLKDSIDGVSFKFPKSEDTRYQVQIRTLGNQKLGNKEATESTTFAYSTMIDAKIIPEGTDVAAFIKENLTDSEEEQAFELKAGVNYTCNDTVDFLANKITFRGDKINRPVVTFGEKGIICTSAQLKVKYINFDCTAMKAKGGVIEMSANPPAAASAEARGIMSGKNNKAENCYVLVDPIIIQDCAFKNVPACFFHVGNHPWGIQDLRVKNCVIQLNNDGSRNSNAAVFSAYSSGYAGPSGSDFYYGCIRNLTVEESTIMNIVSNSKNYNIRFNNKDIDRIFPTADGSLTWNDNTFIRVYDKKNFADRTPNQAKYVITYDNNIFYDTWRIQKVLQGNCTVNYHQELNTIWCIGSTTDGKDKSTWATEEDPGFSEAETMKELDFSKTNYGLSLKPTGAISSTIGDPRWLE